MHIWQGVETYPTDRGASAVTIGVFDGLHRGHAQLARAAAGYGKDHDIPAILLSFDPHPSSVVGKKIAPLRLSSIEFRAQLAAEIGITDMVVLNFTPERATQDATEFVEEVLVERLHAQHVVVGENFRFGARAAGTPEMLTELGKKYGFTTEIIPLLQEEGHTVSSTYIRKSLADARIADAIEALGHLPRVAGEVVHGAGRGGRDLGFPTANISFAGDSAIPGDGVYAGWFAILDDDPIEGTIEPHKWYPTAISVGTNPTFDGVVRTVEAFVLDESADLYNRQAVVEFVDRVRGMEKFDSVDELLVHMNRDVEKTREILKNSTVPPTRLP
ncbi:MAG: bifunctional riboflavin kinase/FAD synthetase [Lawsonella sp.]